MTLTAVLLAAGTIIGAVVGAITNALKSIAKVLGNGLKEVVKKMAAILPGLPGTIASFVFKAAGQVIVILAEHIWQLILAAVIEKALKRQRR